MSEPVFGAWNSETGLFVPVKLLAAIVRFASASHLGGVGLDADRGVVYLIATDGHSCVRVPTDVPRLVAGRDCVWSTGAVEAAIAAARRGKHAHAILEWSACSARRSSRASCRSAAGSGPSRSRGTRA